jgi:hypothetical protein
MRLCRSLPVLNEDGKQYGLPRYLSEFREVAVLLKREAGVTHEQLHERFASYYGGPSLSEFSSSGTALSGSSGYTGGGLNTPVDVAVDSSGNVWVSDYPDIGLGNSLSKFSNAGVSPMLGLQSAVPRATLAAESLSRIASHWMALATSGSRTVEAP